MKEFIPTNTYYIERGLRHIPCQTWNESNGKERLEACWFCSWRASSESQHWTCSPSSLQEIGTADQIHIFQNNDLHIHTYIHIYIMVWQRKRGERRGWNLDNELQVNIIGSGSGTLRPLALSTSFQIDTLSHQFNPPNEKQLLIVGKY